MFLDTAAVQVHSLVSQLSGLASGANDPGSLRELPRTLGAAMNTMQINGGCPFAPPESDGAICNETCLNY